jgi:XTP/dITP diphosphohydrolase
VLADDSGLEVSALDGRPGVTTAYYGGAGLSWHERRLRVLDDLAATASSDRSARFVCYLHYISADGRERAAEGFVNGTIAEAERGEQGFSFDPIFFYPPLSKTFAEIDERAKNRVSHRAAALAALLEMVNVTSA